MRRRFSAIVSRSFLRRFLDWISLPLSKWKSVAAGFGLPGSIIMARVLAKITRFLNIRCFTAPLCAECLADDRTQRKYLGSLCNKNSRFTGYRLSRFFYTSTASQKPVPGWTLESRNGPVCNGETEGGGRNRPSYLRLSEIS